MILAFFGLGSVNFLGEVLWKVLAASGFFSLMACIYIKLTELHAKQKDIEKKLGALLSQQTLTALEQAETSSPDKL